RAAIRRCPAARLAAWSAHAAGRRPAGRGSRRLPVAPAAALPYAGRAGIRPGKGLQLPVRPGARPDSGRQAIGLMSRLVAYTSASLQPATYRQLATAVEPWV